ncbi:Kynurenine formamidase [Trinorchestia longiramus]|nr:Kynurenine formamidase [Trinorchestia longiramus]
MFLFLLMTFAIELTGARLLDMSYSVDEESIRWITTPEFNKTTLVYGYQPNGAWVESYFVAFPEHISTHLDAPSHFAHDKNSVEQIPIEDLVASAVVKNLEMFLLSIFLPCRYYNRTAYVGTYTNDETKLHYPGLSAGAAQLLASYYQASGRRVVGVGIDTMSIDPGSSRDFLAHQALASQNIYMLENVANLEELPVTGAQVTVMPIKLKRGSGGPCRILAHIPDSGAIGLGRPTLPSLLLVLVSLLFVH